jgi:hypothetical protein
VIGLVKWNENLVGFEKPLGIRQAAAAEPPVGLHVAMPLGNRGTLHVTIEDELAEGAGRLIGLRRLM